MKQEIIFKPRTNLPIRIDDNSHTYGHSVHDIYFYEVDNISISLSNGHTVKVRLSNRTFFLGIDGNLSYNLLEALSDEPITMEDIYRIHSDIVHINILYDIAHVSFKYTETDDDGKIVIIAFETAFMDNIAPYIHFRSAMRNVM